MRERNELVKPDSRGLGYMYAYIAQETFELVQVHHVHGYVIREQNLTISPCVEAL